VALLTAAAMKGSDGNADEVEEDAKEKAREIIEGFVTGVTDCFIGERNLSNEISDSRESANFLSAAACLLPSRRSM
jgi:hypothetical protein